jgi:release factor glutamine methyltransferase
MTPSDSTSPDADVVARLRAAGCVFAEDEAALLVEAAGTPDELDRLVDRRVIGEPLEQILGWALFRGLRIRVDPGVFVPRLRTEFLVETTLAHLAERPGPLLVLDLCCGSGAAGAAVEAARGDVTVVAADIDPRSVACARQNLRRPEHDAHDKHDKHKAHDENSAHDTSDENVFEGDLFDALPPAYRGRFDAIIANAPYVPTDEIDFMPRDARLHEPLTALDGGLGGTAIQARIARDAAGWLRPGGLLVIETSGRQAPVTEDLVRGGGLAARTLHSPDLDATLVAGVDQRTQS